jgi:hypothetical protein
MLAQYGEDCTTQRKVYQWVEVSKVGEQASSMKTAQAVLKLHRQQTVLNKLML